MKRSDKSKMVLARLLAFGVPILLLVANVLLGISGEMNVWAFVANIFLPGGIFLLLMSIQGRVGRNTLLIFPLMFLAAFQIVLLFLYADGSVIGVDMYLNLVTTNPGEATELLANLKVAILMVCLLYVPPIILGIVAIRRKIRLDRRDAKFAFKCGLISTIIGIIFVGVSKIFVPGYAVNEQIFPYNVIYNSGIAAKRTNKVSLYKEQSAGYVYDSLSHRPEIGREVYVAVVGETSRASHWQLYGYQRETNPQLSQVSDSNLVCFDFVLSESNTTHKSVPLMLSPLTAHNFDDELNYTRSIITAFKEAGFHTAYISNQGHNRSYIDFFASEADEVYFMREPNAGQRFSGRFDIEMLEPLDSVLAKSEGKLLIVLHQYGSHFNYKSQYEENDIYFMPDDASEAVSSNRAQLVNAYDNSIRHTDRFLRGIIDRLDSLTCMAGMVYASDHGEDIFDDSRNRFLHASPTPTFNQLYVPMLVYFNDSLRSSQPAFYANARGNRHKALSSSMSFAPTLLQMAGISTMKVDETYSVISSDCKPVEMRVFLSDRNEALSLQDAGFHRYDFEKLDSLVLKVGRDYTQAD